MGALTSWAFFLKASSTTWNLRLLMCSGCLECDDADTYHEIGFLQVGIGVNLGEDGQTQVLVLQILRGTDRGHVTGETLAIEIVSVLNLDITLKTLFGVVGDVACTLHRCDTDTGIPVETAGTEGYGEFQIGGVGTVTVDLEVVAQNMV